MHSSENQAYQTENLSTPKIIETKTLLGEQVECSITPFGLKPDHPSHIYHKQKSISYNIPTSSELNLLLNIKDNGEMIPVATAGIRVEEDVLIIELIQRVRTYVEDPNDFSEIVHVDDDIKIEFTEPTINSDHPLKSYMQGENRIPWQKILIDQCTEQAYKDGYKKIKIESGFASKYLNKGLPLSLAISEYDKQIVDEEGWRPVNFLNKIISKENVDKLKTLFRRITKGKVETLEQAVSELGRENLPVYWEKELFQPMIKEKLINPVGNQDALQIIQVDDETLEIEWANRDFKRTVLSSRGPEANMYKYIKNRFPNLEDAFLAGFSIMTDDDGKPQTIGDRGGGSSIVSRLEEKEN